MFSLERIYCREDLPLSGLRMKLDSPRASNKSLIKFTRELSQIPKIGKTEQKEPLCQIASLVYRNFYPFIHNVDFHLL